MRTLLIVLGVLAVWVVLSCLAVLLFAIGSKLGYRRGYEEGYEAGLRSASQPEQRRRPHAG